MEINANDACLGVKSDLNESSWIVLDPVDMPMDSEQVLESILSPLNVWAYFQANSGNLMNAKEMANAYNHVNNMLEHSIKLSNLADAIDIASPTDLKKIAEEAVNVCSNCTDKIRCFTDSMKTISNKLSEGVKLINNELGETMQTRCADYLDSISKAKEVSSLKEHLAECLAQENINQANMLEQIRQQNQQIRQSVQSAYEITSYFNFITAVFNFGMAANALMQTCEIVEQHKKMMEQEKKNLVDLSMRLGKSRQQVEEIINNLNSVNSLDFNIDNSMYIRLYEISNSVMQIQLELERIKGTLNFAIGQTQSQKVQHVTGAFANALGATLSTVAAVGQLGNIWNIGAVGLNVVGSAISYIGIRKCNSDIDALQVLAKSTEELIQNANDNMKLIKSAQKNLLDFKEQSTK